MANTSSMFKKAVKGFKKAKADKMNGMSVAASKLLRGKR